jgi:hypothetical protein
VYAHTYEFNAPYMRPIEPLGEVAGNPPPAQVFRFRQMSRAYGATGVSWWDWQQSSARDWLAVGRPAGNLVGFTAAATMPTLTLRSQGGIWAGDLVVWAQEHLYKAGFTVTIDGGFGAETQAAVESFQSAQGIPVTGMIDPPTWAALLRYPPASVTWVKRQGKTVATAARGGLTTAARGGLTIAARGALTLPTPASARMRATRYEIPTDLGAGPHLASLGKIREASRR